MSELTPNLNLFKYDTNSDSSQAFSISNALNPNWDIIDNAFSQIRAVKGYEENGNILTDPVGLAYVKKYAHSTFDLDKFTVVGSPTITDDGFVRDFSQSDYLYIPAISQLMTANSWEIISPYFKPMTGYLNNDRAIIRTYSVVNGVENRIYLGVNNAHPKCAVRINGELHAFEDSSVTFNSSSWYQMKLMYTSTQYKAYWRTKDGEWTALSTAWDNTAKLQNLTNQISICYFDGGGGDYSFRGEIDLKQFAVNINGAPYFSGNKTGIDTIKPDDYTVVGTPTISADGVASGFSASNNLEKAIPITSSNSFDVDFDVDTSTTLTNIGFLTLRESGAERIQLDIGGSGNVLLRYYNGSSIQFVSSNTTLTANTKYNFKVSYASGTLTFYINGVQKATTSSFCFGTITKCVIGYTANASLTSGSIDLNTFKIYVDCNLVYQPCLKIPYNESKTGSKVVDSIYKDRVTSMYEQFGFAPYYVLEDTNNQYVLPMGEFYGYINKNKITINMLNNGGL